MGNLAAEFLAPPATGTVGVLGSTTAASTATKLTFAALAVLATGQFTPEATVNTGTAVQAVGPPWNGVGWRSADIVPLSDTGVLLAGTYSLNIRATASAAITAATFTAILYLVTATSSAEIARATSGGAATSLATAVATDFAFSFGVLQTNIPANGKLVVSLFLQGTNAAAASQTVTITTGTNSVLTPPTPTYQITSARTGSESQGSTQAASRVVATSRSASETQTPTDSGARVASYSRIVSEAQAIIDTASRVQTLNRATSEVRPAQIDSVTRTTSINRSVPDTISTTDSASRVIGLTKTSSETTSQADTGIKTVTYSRVTLYQFQPGDEPASAQTRAIRGYILNSDHSVFTSGATVMLIRDDGVVVQTQTSAQDGSYVFPRNFLDTHTYTVAAFATVSGSPVEAITERGLSPV